MNAYKFVDHYGSKEAIEKLRDCEFMECESFSWNVTQTISVNELKQAIEDFELVEKVGGLDVAKKQVKQAHEKGYLTISVWMKIKKENKEYEGFGCLYIDKLEAAITRIEEGLRDE